MMRLYSALFIRILSRSSDVYLLKVVTLAVAFSVSIVVMLFSIHQFGYDTGHEDAGIVFRVLAHNTDKDYTGNRLSASIPRAALKRISDRFDDSGTITRVKALKKVTVLVDRNPPAYDQKIYAVDSTINQIFSFDITAGNIDNFAKSTEVVAIMSRRTAWRYFENKDAIGKAIRLTTFGDTLTVPVVAVFDDFPTNTHEDFDIFIRYDSSAIATLNFTPDQSSVYGRRASGEVPPPFLAATSSHLEYLFQPIREIYFGPRVLSEEARHGDVYSMTILICIVSLIFLLAICSFINLSTITLPNRSKEIAVKKLAGKTQFQLLLQFVYECFALTSVSLLAAVVLILGTRHPISAVLGIDIVDRMVNSNFVFPSAIVLMVFAVVISPVFMVIRFIRASPIRLLSTDTITFPRFRRIITVVQFGVSIFLMASSLLIGRQINYSLIKEPGRNHDQVVYMACPPNISDSAVHKIKAGWPDKNPNVRDAVAVSQLPNQLQGKEVGSDLFVLEVDYNFRDFFQFTMLEGDWFEYTDRDSVVVINQMALKKMSKVDRHVIGIMQDINSPFNQPEQPVKIRHARETTHNWICFRVEEADIRNTVKWIEGRMHAKGAKGKVYYSDEHFEIWLAYQDQLNALSRILTIISMLLAGCAIYGLTVSLVRDRVKEIAVHHLFGARLSDVTHLLAGGLLRQLFTALVIFGPVTFIGLNELLRTFVYATIFSWLDLLYPMLYCLVVIVGLCVFQAFRLNRSDFISTLKGRS
ncbi:ABC-type antimicrobial peptide transport system, permease component [Chryseolinea serpens]|uniref:ABC-type antimicrobial peptide transport system, permease component n=1 Tax=Chryseolinea serpens TaxID=947013 RepID=A0A1M5MQR4_9BACT|nr:ABC transporter permease [Chryseolinea serpens]SHG79229.1 ABC-type antimicrobial peptide transport system, permease component [Chryseolinea serpens]